MASNNDIRYSTGIISPAMRNLTTSLMLMLAAFLIYLPCAQFEFVYYDDIRILADHPELYNGLSLGESAKAILSRFPREEPLLLRDLSWALDSHLFGFGNPHGFHFVNILLHAGVVALGFLTLLQMTRRYSIALASTLCFLSLAIHAEPVAWIMGRKDLLAALFGFLALLTHSHALDATSTRTRYGWYFASLLSVTLALFSKINAAVFPGVLFLLALFQPWLRGEPPPACAFPWNRVPRALAGILPHLLISLLVSHWYRGVLHEFGVLNRGYTATPLEHLVNLAVLNPLTWLREFQLLFTPWDLPFLHGWPGNLTHFQLHHVMTASAVWLGLAGLTLYFLAKRRDLAFYLLAFFVLMIPYMNIQYIGIWVANRYLYFSSFFLSALFTTLVVNASPRRATYSAGIGAILLILFCTANIWNLGNATAVWRNAETLWTREVQRPEATPDAFYSLASYYYTAAIHSTNQIERDALLDKTEALVAEARPRYDKPYLALQNIYLLDALIAMVRNAPPDRQLAALLEAEKMGPANDAILWQLTLFHHRKALSLSHDTERTETARQALGYYSRYRRATFKTDGFKAKDQSIRAEFLSDFPALAADLEQLK